MTAGVATVDSSVPFDTYTAVDACMTVVNVEYLAILVACNAIRDPHIVSKLSVIMVATTVARCRNRQLLADTEVEWVAAAKLVGYLFDKTTVSNAISGQRKLTGSIASKAPG